MVLYKKDNYMKQSSLVFNKIPKLVLKYKLKRKIILGRPEDDGKNLFPNICNICKYA
jgi:hypothetical protein